MQVVQILDSKIIKIGLNMYEAHIKVSYKTFFGNLKIKWVLLEHSCWAGNLDWFGSVELAKDAIRLYILKHKHKHGEDEIVFRGIPE